MRCSALAVASPHPLAEGWRATDGGLELDMDEVTAAYERLIDRFIEWADGRAVQSLPLVFAHYDEADV